MSDLCVVKRQKGFRSFDKRLGCKKNLNDGEDRISNLPCEILCHILSFLPTKHAVGTCILSTRWKNLFPQIPNLRLSLIDTLLLHSQSNSSNNSPMSFMNFVDRLFYMTLRDVTSIHALILDCQKIDDGRRIAHWVDASLRLNVKLMDLRLHRMRDSSLLLNSLLGCKIVALRLYLDVVDGTTEWKFNLPNLKSLTVMFMTFEAVNILLDGCPSVEYLFIMNCHSYPGDTLRICIPSLKGLKLANDCYYRRPKVELDCPRLEYLNCSGYLANQYMVKKLNSVQIARFNLYQNASQRPLDSDVQAAQLITVCCDAKKFWLSEKFVTMLNRLTRLPQFPKLVSLSIKVMRSDGWELLPSLLECAPNLKTVIVARGFNKKCYESFKASQKVPISIYFSPRGEKWFRLEIQRQADKQT